MSVFERPPTVDRWHLGEMVAIVPAVFPWHLAGVALSDIHRDP